MTKAEKKAAIAEFLKTNLTDDEIIEVYREYADSDFKEEAPVIWGMEDLDSALECYTPTEIIEMVRSGHFSTEDEYFRIIESDYETHIRSFDKEGIAKLARSKAMKIAAYMVLEEDCLGLDVDDILDKEE